MPRVKLGDVAKEYKATIKDNSGLPIVGLEHLQSGEISLTSWDEDVDKSFSKGFVKGTILFGRRRAYLKKAALAPFDGVCSGDIIVIQARPEKIDPELLPFIIQNDTLFDFAMSKSAGGLSPRVKWNDLKEFEFELPERDEQLSLVEILKAAYETKEAYKRQLLATDELVKAQFIEMFGSKKCTKLADFATVCAGQSSPSDTEFSTHGVPFIKAGNLEGLKLGIMQEADCNLVSPEIVNKRKLKLQKAGSVLVAKSGMSCLSGHIYLLKEDAYVVSHLACIRAKIDVYAEMVKWYLIVNGTQDLIKNPSYPAIQIPQFENMEFPIANQDEAEAFAAIAIQSDKVKVDLKNAIDSIEDLIKSLIENGIDKREV